MDIVLKRLAISHFNQIIANLYGTGVSRVIKYTILITKVLVNNDNFFSHIICIPHGQRLVNIIEIFKKLVGIPQICELIDGSHIKLVKEPTFEFVSTNYWNKHDHHSVVL
jgi:hypothetical protein